MAKAAKPETREFQAEVSRLLDILVHSVYSEREVFLRELISNASDACDKLRYEAITSPELLEDDPKLKITITADKEKSTLIISDNGIGMDHDELAGNLGTLAKSGTRAFMEQSAKGKEEDKAALIGKFGIGFYSAFMVAEKIVVASRRAGDTKAHIWSSDGGGKYEIAPAKKSDKISRGTSITLYLREDAKEFLEEARIESIVKTYSDHIPLPVEMAGKENKVLNAARALWMRPKSEITNDDYKELYGHISGLYDDPAKIIHYRAEGRHEYSVLLFIPENPPFDLFDPDRKGRIRLYVKRVLITSEADMLPAYLRFVRGIVDSQDMPLTVSREMLQNNPVAASIRKALTKRVLSELVKMADKEPETFDKLWRSFGAVLKEGLYEDYERRDELLGLARFETTTSEGKLRNLKDYVADMAENQTAIYFITGDSMEAAAASPQLEGFRARGVEVLLLTDPVDSFWTSTATGFDGKPFKSVTQGATDLDAIALKEKDKKGKDKKDKDKSSADAAALAALIKQELEGEVSDVVLSSRLVESPVCLVAGAGGPDLGLEKILQQAQGSAPAVQRVLEINPDHEMINSLAANISKDKSQINDAAHLLLDQAMILEGDPPRDPAAFAARLNRLIVKGIG